MGDLKIFTKSYLVTMEQVKSSTAKTRSWFNQAICALRIMQYSNYTKILLLSLFYELKNMIVAKESKTFIHFSVILDVK